MRFEPTRSIEIPLRFKATVIRDAQNSKELYTFVYRGSDPTGVLFVKNLIKKLLVAILVLQQLIVEGKMAEGHRNKSFSKLVILVRV